MRVLHLYRSGPKCVNGGGNSRRAPEVGSRGMMEQIITKGTPVRGDHALFMEKSKKTQPISRKTQPTFWMHSLWGVLFGYRLGESGFMVLGFDAGHVPRTPRPYPSHPSSVPCARTTAKTGRTPFPEHDFLQLENLERVPDPHQSMNLGKERAVS